MCNAMIWPHCSHTIHINAGVLRARQRRQLQHLLCSCAACSSVGQCCRRLSSCLVCRFSPVAEANTGRAVAGSYVGFEMLICCEEQGLCLCASISRSFSVMLCFWLRVGASFVQRIALPYWMPGWWSHASWDTVVRTHVIARQLSYHCSQTAAVHGDARVTVCRSAHDRALHAH